MHQRRAADRMQGSDILLARFPLMRAICSLSLLLAVCAAMPGQVTVTEESTVIPTYPAGAADPNPMFFTGRVYQGAKGMVYPYPMYDKLSDEKTDKTYKLVCLENEYVKVCVLPEIGGRIFSAVDKTNGYNFFYKQSVIKPALIGMLGAWISGGVEWNIPHHHRASSFNPVLYRTEERADGSKTVWVGELELRDRMRWAIGLTLRPKSSVLEARVTALNTTPLANSLLYFANVAVHTNENYQVIFPPRTQFATQHAKREFSKWPVADGVYNGIDFTKGVDVSMWKNHPSSISMFCWNEEDVFLAGYDHGKQAGTMHVADPHQVPGKKFFTWGTGPSGRLWDKILSDTDGPYLELMVGAWSDNQPDYSWMQPYETKSVEQFWYPFRDIGGAKEATRDAAVNLEVAGRKAKVGFYVTRPVAQARAVLTVDGKEVWTETADLDPAKTLVKEVELPAAGKVRAALVAGGKELVAYAPVELTSQPMPQPASAPGDPKEIRTVEELVLTGQRLEQFHNPSVDPEPYYREALRRDAGDSQANTALGILKLKQARYGEAEKVLRAAADRVEQNYTRAKNCEPLYYLGLSLKWQEKYAAAEVALQRAAWCYAWQSPAYFQLAEIASLRGRTAEALALAERSLVTNQWNTKALSLKALLLQRMGEGGKAAETRRQIRAIDPLDLRGYRELMELAEVTMAFPQEGLELVADCVNAGLWREALFLLDRFPGADIQTAYLQGLVAEKTGQEQTARNHYLRASKMRWEGVFPFQREMMPAFEAALRTNAGDARASYLLGLFLYDRQPERAAELWEQALKADPQLALAHRNLAVYHAQRDGGVPQAAAHLEKAIALNGKEALWLFELDRLYEFAQKPVAERLALFERNRQTAETRDDAMSRLVQIQVLAGQYDAAIATMKQRHFHLWEGGARFNVQDAWTDAHLQRGHGKLAAKDYSGALADYRAAIEYPENLEVTRAYRGSRAPETLYFAGVALEALGRQEEARKCWQEGAQELLGTEDNPRPTVNSGAALLYYQALSLERLGQKERARVIYQSLLQAAEAAMKPGEENEFFAKFGERQPPRMRQAMAHYIAGLGHEGLGEKQKAEAEFRKAGELNAYLVGVKRR
jgi:Tfp pilus assembly protein PilF